MESDQDYLEQLRVADRAAAAPFLDYPETPWWYAAVAGAWFGLMVLALGTLHDHRWPTLVGIVALISIEGAFFAWYRNRWGTWPKFGRNAPPEIRKAAMSYYIAVGVVILVCVAAWFWVGSYAAAIWVWLSATAVLGRYEQIYAAAAARVRERLG